MKIILSVSFFLLSCFALSGEDGYKRNPYADIIHYDFSISISDTNNIIYGHTEIAVNFSGHVSTLEFDLKNKGTDEKGMTVQNVTFNKRSLNWVHAGNRIVINLDDSVKAGSQGIISIDYSGVPADGLIISENKFGDRTFFADNWPDRARNWIPCVDHPYEKATVDFIITSPDHYEVVGSGYLVEESCMPRHTKLTHWKEDVPLATKVMAIGVAPFAGRLEGNVNGIPVWSWVFTENRKEGFYDYSVALKPLAFYSQLIGPYPYEKLANVQSKTIFGGLENAGCIFYSENSVTGKGNAEDLMAHEIAHQWFGNSVTENDWHHIWLSEGFATYLTAVYQEKTYGKEKLDETMKSARDRVIGYYLRSPRPVVDTTITDLMKLLNANSYQKGAWVLHMLRRELGDELFWKGMRLYYEDYKNKNALTSDFQKAMEKVSNKNLGNFFKQWLFEAGQPNLKISTIPGERKGFTDLIIEQTQNSLFSFDIELQIKDLTGSYILKIPISERITRKTLKTEKILEIIPDPNVNLLFRIVPD
ncbi:MAG: M1 family metallopeptidase [Bacteroidales bacterium]|jgi:aminopeptidase N